MSFEKSLPNEILLEIFKLLQSADVIRAFCCLNELFNALLLSHMTENGIDFRSISKTNFEFICQQQLSSIAPHITILCLSDDDETPYQSKLLLRNGFTLNQFQSLRSLSLYELHSDETWEAFMNGLPALSKLTDLKLIKCYAENVQPSCRTIMNAVWNLPNLTHCHFDIKFQHDIYLATFTSRSSSLKHLTIQNISCPLFELSQLFRCTQNLEYISLKSQDKDPRQILPVMLSLTTLELHVEEHQHMIINLSLTIPNLRNLIVRSSSLHLNGQQWQAIINNHLPQLRVLQFKMNYSCHTSDHKQEMDELLDSFRSPFWLEDHQWYVRCDLVPRIKSWVIEIYTIPYAFSDLFVSLQALSKSTAPNADDYWLYDSVETLHYDIFIRINNPVRLQARFPNVRHLSIPFSYTDYLLPAITNFSRLKSLKIIETCSPSFIQCLLNEASQLYSFSPPDYMITLNNISIRRLDLLSGVGYLTTDQCNELSHSSIMIRCEVLLIKAKRELDILPLINNAHNLHTVTIQCENDRWPQDISTRNNAVIIALREHLPQTAEIDRDPKFRCYIRIWLR